ncbi:MAG: T9SS type A sorting domain-containing protein [Aureispira sp.]|nr:T9SS type A sorting domain-containing protein [Aureispira sp.]
MKTIFFVFLFLYTWQITQGQASMVADINMGTGNSSPAVLTEFNNKLYFQATDGINGTELWNYDGTNPPSMAADINVGTGNSSPAVLTVFNGKLYFQATDGINGTELWNYDGTNPPSMAADIRVGTGSSIPAELTVFNGKLYFSASNGMKGTELWEYDGANPPSMVADIRVGSSSSFPSYLTVFNGKLYFQADDGTAVNGRELWVYDGTNPPSIVTDIRVGSSGSSPNHLMVFNSKLYFQANDGINGTELWVYDGSSTSMVADINPSFSSSPSYLTVYNNKLYFQADDDLTGNGNQELWEYDGSNPPSMVADIRAGGSGGAAYPTVLGNKLYFRATDGVNTGIWVYDGNTASLATNVNPIISYGALLTTFNDKLFFQAAGSGNGNELWQYSPPPSPFIHVDINASGANDGSSWGNAFTSLQEAIDSASIGDTIVVAEGTYLPSKNITGTVTAGRAATFYIYKDVVIQGGYPTGGGGANPMINKTILSGDLGAQGDASDNSYNVIYLRNASSTLVLDGLTIEHGNANGSPYPYNRGGGISNNGMSSGNSSPTIQNCIFRWNMATFGGAICNMSNFNGTVDATITGCLFYENMSAKGSVIVNGTYQGGTNNSVITNCTFADNVGVSIANPNGGATITIQNSIIWDNGAPLYNYGNETTVQYCLFKSSVLPAGTIDAGNNIFAIDPAFIDVANDNYKLKAYSPVVDMGSNTLLPNGYTLDLAGGDRIINTNVDLGAMEVAASSPIIYVNQSATGLNNGTSWADAYTSLKAGMDVATSGTSVWVAGGTYMATGNTDRTISFEVASGVKVYGGFAGSESQLSQRDWSTNLTILSGDLGTQGNASDNSYNVIRIENADATTTLDGLIIEAGNANGSSYPFNRGGGLSNNGMYSGSSSPTIQNCVFRWNTAIYGGAICNMSNFNGAVNSMITGCLFYENMSAKGSAITNGTYQGGSNNSVITNCTFVDNAGTSIANPNGGATIIVQNSIIWDNGAPLYNYANEATVQYCLLKSGALPAKTIDGGNNMFATDPMFVDAANDDYKLQGASPAIGAGSNGLLPAGYTLDLAYTTRQNGATVELGCYEDGVSSAKTIANNNNPITVDENTSAEEEQVIETVMEEELEMSSLEETATVMNMTVYPNPVQDIMNIRLEGVQETVSLQLLNTAGQTIQQEVLEIQEGQTIQLDMSRLANGIYLLNVQLKDGTRLNERVIKF